ncbi:MAG: hypothetical protein L3J26_01215 [Candidatus Polarisedimenticolaceae bacterium]|nr:hypothetical protein [Candidatus Polarisedimenticolaceae bacterium]
MILKQPLRANAFLVLFLGSGMLSQLVYGYGFEPTAVEWATWPVYCKAAYIRTGASAQTPFTQMVSKAQRKAWMRRYAAYLSGGLHHYCTGGIYFRRAKVASNEGGRTFLLTRALGEFNYTAIRIQENHPLWSEIYANVGLVNWELGHHEKAFSALNTGIRVQPESPSAYLAMAQLFFKEKKLGKAVDILKRAKAKIGDKSVELSYFLGLAYFETGQMEKAKEEAKKAYEGGYPLLGLKNKLKRKGILW